MEGGTAKLHLEPDSGEISGVSVEENDNLNKSTEEINVPGSFVDDNCGNEEAACNDEKMVENLAISNQSIITNQPEESATTPKEKNSMTVSTEL